MKEIVYQAVPCVGMAKAFEFRYATNGILAVCCIERPLVGRSTTAPETRAAKGQDVQKRTDRR